MPLYLVEALTQYRIVYAIQAENQQQAEDWVWLDRVGEEFGQKHLGELVVSSREVNEDECIRVHDELNEYLAGWTREEKLARVHKVDETNE